MVENGELSRVDGICSPKDIPEQRISRCVTKALRTIYLEQRCWSVTCTTKTIHHQSSGHASVNNKNFDWLRTDFAT